MSIMQVAPVTGPTLVAPAYGILSAAVVVDDNSGRAAGFGFEYTPDFCGPARLGVAACQTAAQKVAEEGRDLVEGEPFVVYALHTCQSLGFDDAQGRASRALTAGEGRAVEEWLGQRLSAEAEPTPGDTPWTAGSPKEALAALEHYIACNYGGRGTIHMQRGTASLLLTEGALETSGTNLRTKLGNTVSAGCYDVGSGDDMYATGTVTLQRGSVFAPPNPVLDQATNDMYALAERTYAGAWECFAVRVTVTGGTP